MKKTFFIVVFVFVFYNMPIAQQKMAFEDSIIAYSKCRFESCESLNIYFAKMLCFNKDSHRSCGNYSDSLDEVMFQYDSVVKWGLQNMFIISYIGKYSTTSNKLIKQRMLNKFVDILVNKDYYDKNNKWAVLFPAIINLTPQQLGKQNVDLIKSFIHHVAIHGYREPASLDDVLTPVCYWAAINNLLECRNDIEKNYSRVRNATTEAWKKKRTDVMYLSFLARLKDDKAAEKLYNQLNNDKEKALGYKYRYILLSRNLLLSKLLVEDLFNDKDYFVVHPEEEHMKEKREYLKETGAICLLRIVDFKGEKMELSKTNWYGKNMADIEKMRKWFQANKNFKLKNQIDNPRLDRLEDLW